MSSNNPFTRLAPELVERIYQRYLQGDKTTDLINEFQLRGVTAQNFTRMMPPKQLETPCPACGQEALVEFRHNRTRVHNAKHPVKECTNCDYKVWPHQEMQEQLAAPKFLDLSVSDRFHLTVLLCAEHTAAYASQTQLTRIIEQLHKVDAILPCEDQVTPFRLKIEGFDYRLNIDDGSGRLMELDAASEKFERYIKMHLFQEDYVEIYQSLVIEAVQFALLAIVEDRMAAAGYPFLPTPSLMKVMSWLLEIHSPHQVAFLTHQLIAPGSEMFKEDAFSWENSSRLAAQLICRSDQYVKQGWGDPKEECFPREILHASMYRLLGIHRDDIFQLLGERLTIKSTPLTTISV